MILESICACVLGPWPWPRAFLSLASRVSVLGKAVLGLSLGFFCVLGLGLEHCVLDSTSDIYFVPGGICTCLRVSSFPMSREFRFLTTEFLASSKPQAEIIIVKRSIQGRDNVTSVWVEHRLCN